MPSKLEHALDYARRGWAIFPLLPDSKKPAVDKWQFRATTDETQIRKWWEKEPDYNIGVRCDGRAIADIDVRKATDEIITEFAEKYLANGHKSLTVTTWSGGKHIIYSLPPGLTLSSQNDAFAHGIDLKTGSGAYVVGVGSTIQGKAYKWANDREVIELPQGHIDLLAERDKLKKAEKSANAGKRVVEEDDEAVRLASEWLLNHAPRGEEGNRDNTAFQVAARLYDYGLAKQTVYEMMAAVWNEGMCDPPLEREEIERIADSAGRNRQNPIGQKHPTAAASGFDPVVIPPRANGHAKEEPEWKEPVPEPPSFEMFDEAAAKALTESADPLVKGLLDKGAMSTWYGPPKTGKTFVLLWLAACVASGTPFAGHKARRGAVVYIAMEGTGGILKRLRAIQLKHPDMDCSSFAIVRRKIDLLHGKKGVEEVAEICRQVAKQTGQAVELVVVDTVARAISGGDENSSVDMGALIHSFDAIRAATGAHLAAIHHTSKSNPHAARGFGGLLGAVDSEFEIQKGMLKATNMREGEAGKLWAAVLEPVQLGVDADGEPILSFVVKITDKREMQIALTTREAEVLEVIKEKMGGDDSPESFTPTDLQEWLKTALNLSVSLGRVSQYLSKLNLKAHVEKAVDGQWVPIWI